MEKGVKSHLLGIAVAFMLLISSAHVITHIIVYQTNIPLAKTIGISGNAIGKLEITETFEQDLKNNYPKISGISKIILIAEWSLLIVLVIFSFVRTKINIRKEHISIKSIQRKDKSKTDIDLLYDLLKEKKRIRLSTISNVFKVEKETAKDWAEILENGNLAYLNYPRFGEPELAINEDGQT